jgi:hypothetical protein
MGINMGDVPTPQSGGPNQDVGGYALSKYSYEKEYMDTGAQARDVSPAGADKAAMDIFASETAAPYDVAHDPDQDASAGDHDTPARMGVYSGGQD